MAEFQFIINGELVTYDKYEDIQMNLNMLFGFFQMRQNQREKMVITQRSNTKKCRCGMDDYKN